MKKIEVPELIWLVKNGEYSEQELQEIKTVIGSHLSYLTFCKNQGIEPYEIKEKNINCKIIAVLKEGEEVEEKRIKDFAKKLEIEYEYNSGKYIFFRESEDKSLIDIPALRFLLGEMRDKKDLYLKIEYENLRTGEKEVVK